MPRDVTVIIAAAGGASPPTWATILPDGRPALASLIERLGCRHVSRLVFVCLKSAVEAHCHGEDLQGLIERVNADLVGRVSVLMLDAPTKCAVDTVCQTIAKANITGAVFVKDADGAFNFEIPPAVGGSYCVALRIHDGNVHAINELTRKSFVQQCGGLLTNIVEKKIISDTICVGGYCFESAEEYVAHAKDLENVPATFFASPTSPSSPPTPASPPSPSAQAATATARKSGILFNSDILLSLLAAQGVVSCRFVEHFDDWKSTSGVANFAKSFHNVVVALEDQLCERVSGNAFHAIELAAMINNVNKARALSLLTALFKVRPAVVEELALKSAAGRSRIVVLSSLPKALEKVVGEFLRAAGVPVDGIVCGMYSDRCSVSVFS